MRWALVVLLGSATAAAAPVHVVGDACDLGALHSDRGEVSVAVARTGATVAARVTFDDGTGHLRGPRVLEAATCAELLDAVALVIEMGQTAAPMAAATSEGPLAVRAVVTSPQDSDLTIAAGGAVGVSSHGGMQKLAAGLEWRHGTLAVGLELRREGTETAAIAPGGTVAITTTTVAAVPCRRFGALAACGVIEVGAIHGTGSGLFDARATWSPLVAGGAQLGWELGLGRRLALRLRVEGDIRVTTTRFDVDHMAVWTSSRLALWGGAALLAHFP